ncbi:MAG: S8 family serine peptidase [Candidatus Bathyarchaeia archaeon]
MKKQRIVLCVFTIIAMLFAALPQNLRIAKGAELQTFVPGEVIVGLQAVSVSSIQAVESMGGTVVKQIADLNAMVVQVAVGKEEEFIQNAKSISGFRYAERNGMYKAVYTPNDPYWSYQWNMPRIKADQAWDTYKGSTSVVVAIVDTGIDYNHPDLAAHYKAGGYDWVNNDPDPRDDFGHGTHCAGIVAAVINNGIGVAGVGQSSFLAEKVVDNTGYGSWSNIASGITHATDNGAKVISMSLGGTDYSSLIDSACTYAWNNGDLLVAAAGNNNMSIDTTPFYPASLSMVIAVSASDSSDVKASFSNYGNKIELAAPGVGVLSTMPTYHVTMNDPPYYESMNYDYMSGTSMACPHVAGLAALVWGHNTSLTNSQLRTCLDAGVDDLGTLGKDIYYGYGRINAYKALTGTTPPVSYMRVKPENTIVGVGQTFSVNVTFENLPEGSSGAAGCQFTLNWNSSILNCSWIQEVAFHKAAPELEWDNIWTLKLSKNNTGGHADYAVTWMDLQRAIQGGYAFISANGTWATINFTSIAAGQTALTLTKVVCCDMNAISMPITVVNGSATVLGANFQTQMSFNLIPNPASVGQTVTLIGNLSTIENLPIGGATIRLKLNGASVGTLTTNATGWFKASGQVGSGGQFNVTAEYTGSPQYLPCSSWKILMVKTPTEIYARFFPNLAPPGATVTLKGILVDQFSNRIGSATISLQYSSDYGLNWTQLGTVSTNTYGIFSKSFTALSIGTYVYRMSYAGSSSNMPCTTDITLVVR